MTEQNYPSFDFIEEGAKAFDKKKEDEIQEYPEDITKLVLEGSFAVPFSQMQFFDPKLLNYTNHQLQTIFQNILKGRQNANFHINDVKEGKDLEFTAEEQVMILTFIRLFPNEKSTEILKYFGDYFRCCWSLQEISNKVEEMKKLTQAQKDEIYNKFAHDITEEHLFGLSTQETISEDLVKAQLRPNDFLQCRCVYKSQEDIAVDSHILDNEIVPLLDIIPHLWYDELTDNDLAILRSDKYKWYMRREAILIGRGSIDFDVDVDLSNFGEKACVHISRHQAIISFLMDYNFYIQNIGNRIFRVNGLPIYPGQMGRLPDNALLDFSGILMIFYPNHRLISDLKESVSLGLIKIPDDLRLGDKVN